MAETRPNPKAELEREIHSLKTKLGKAEARVAELQTELETANSSAPADPDRVFGPDALPLEQR